MATRIVLTGGLSGGHTYPLIAVARALRQETGGDIEFLFLGARGPFEGTAMQAEGIPAKFLVIAKWRRYFSLRNSLDVVKFPIACGQALWHLLWFMPDAIFSKGGAASVPIALAAFVYRIPILLHDSDAVAGRANRFVSYFARRIAVAYDRTREFFPPEKVMLTGNPIREELLKGDPKLAQEVFGIDPSRPVVLVIGGSLGARALNQLMVKAMPEIIASGAQVLHVVGRENVEEVRRLVGAVGIENTADYHAVPFLDATQMGIAYAVATIVVSRAGAGSIAELAANRKPSILVPLPTAANDEQRINAHELGRPGAAVVVEEVNASEHLLAKQVTQLLYDEAKQKSLSEKITAFYHADAAQVIAQGILTML